MFGLLLIVTMMASYIATQLPAQMSVNDASHALSVEDQVARLDALLKGAAATGALGGQLSQPISLGSSGLAPFAAPDGSTIGGEVVGSTFSVSYTASGGVHYVGPGGWSAGGNIGGLVSKGTCSESPGGSESPTSIDCTGAANLYQNFTNGSHSVVFTGAATTVLNMTTSYSTVVVAPTGASVLTLRVVGSHDNIWINMTGATTDSITVVGNYDNLTLPTTGSSTVAVYLVGSYDHVVQASTGATTVTINAWGENDVFSASETGAATVTVDYTGFNTLDPTSSTCPYSNLSSTDKVYENITGAGTFNVNYNNTNYSGSGSSGGWSETWSKVNGLTCPYFTVVTVPQRSTGGVGGSLLVQLLNSYDPRAVVALDEGAVVYAQPGGIPELLEGPSLNYSNGKLTLWLPEFVGSVGSETGVGTAEISAQLVSLLNVTLPSDGYSLSGTTSFAVTTPFAAAWTNYLNGPSSPLAGDAKCVPRTSAACVGPFQFNGPLGTVYINVTATALSAQFADYSVSLG